MNLGGYPQATHRVIPEARVGEADPTPATKDGLSRAHASPLKEWPDIGTVATAGPANEFQLEMNLVTPLGGVDHDGMRAFEVAAVDDEPARAVA